MDIFACTEQILRYYQQDVIEDERTFQNAAGRWLKDYYVGPGGLEIIARDTGAVIDKTNRKIHYITVGCVRFVEDKE